MTNWKNAVHMKKRGTRNVMAIFIDNGHNDLISNPGKGCLHFT